MNKSFVSFKAHNQGDDQFNQMQVESGGTVLSTNWSEVGTKEVERKPPDGMEWKKYEVQASI